MYMNINQKPAIGEESYHYRENKPSQTVTEHHRSVVSTPALDLGGP